jgi:hypothetical protein
VFEQEEAHVHGFLLAQHDPAYRAAELDADAA